MTWYHIVATKYSRGKTFVVSHLMNIFVGLWLHGDKLILPCDFVWFLKNHGKHSRFGDQSQKPQKFCHSHVLCYMIQIVYHWQNEDNMHTYIATYWIYITTAHANYYYNSLLRMYNIYTYFILVEVPSSVWFQIFGWPSQ